MPKVNSRLVGTKLKLKFTVTEKGKTENVRLEKPLSSYSDVEKMTFASQTRDLVVRWTFRPALDGDDKPVSIKVIMPVRVVTYGKIYRALASLERDETGKNYRQYYVEADVAEQLANIRRMKLNGKFAVIPSLPKVK